MAWPLFTVAVVGESMAPTHYPDDWLLCQRASTVQPGQVVVVTRPGVGLVVKRAHHVRADGSVWVLGDNPNPAASTDSRNWGWLDASAVVGRVVLRYRRGTR